MHLIEKYFPGITPKQHEQFAALQNLYEHWNAQINVISRKDIEALYEKHILHSLAIAKFITFSPHTDILDIGCGGGFPTIPLAILFPEVQFLAVDSIGKKIKVVNEIVTALHLTNVTALNARAETIDSKFDFIISRAVASALDLIFWSKGKIKAENKNLLTNGFLLLKGGDLKAELNEAHQKYQFKHEEINLKKYFNTDFFETKKLIYIHQ
ncbi:MAG: 16S rRNA (guanine(527)-N(7))-methyltransferase RsmG [Bacteroidetes bacterium]|nr:16S rRNA (guanine(527)-N(7))-methyltransferase RsmG [Bacteroidota bacterium]